MRQQREPRFGWSGSMRSVVFASIVAQDSEAGSSGNSGVVLLLVGVTAGTIALMLWWRQRSTHAQARPRSVASATAPRPIPDVGGQPAVPPVRKHPLVTELERIDPGRDPYRFQRLCDTLGDERVVGAVPKLLQLLEGTGSRALAENNRTAAISALGSIGDPAAVEVLIGELDNYPSYAAGALGDIGDARAVLHLIELLGNDSWPARSSAARALGQLGDRRAVDALRVLNEDSKTEVRQAAEWALTVLGASDAEFYFESLPTQQVKRRLISLGIVDEETVAEMFNLGTYQIRSSSGVVVEPDQDNLVLTDVTFYDGVCLTAIPVDQVAFPVLPAGQPSVVDFSCPTCGSFFEVRLIVTESPEPARELWLTTKLRAVPERVRGLPGVGWPRIHHAAVSVEPVSGGPSSDANWTIVAAGPERVELSEAGELSASNMSQFSVYRIVKPSNATLDQGDLLEMRGTLLCPCGYRIPLDAELGIGGFFDFHSKRSVACPQCNALTGIVGVSTETSDVVHQWLLVHPETGPPGESFFPGTPSGLPELELEELVPAIAHSTGG